MEAGAALATLFGYMLSDIYRTYGHLFSSPSTKRTYTSCISQSSLEEEILKGIYKSGLWAVVRLLKQWLSPNGKGKNLVVDPSMRLKS